MHPSISYPADYHSLICTLHEPLHAESRRNPNRQAREGCELSLAAGYQIDPGNFPHTDEIDLLTGDLRMFLGNVMEVEEITNGTPIRFHKDPTISTTPCHHDETHLLQATPGGITLCAATVSGLRRAIYRLQDEMLIRRAPVVPLGSNIHQTGLHTRISRNPLAPYRWLSGWELEDDVDYYPETYLNRIARSGINALWIPGLFRNLVASREIPEMGPPQHRLDKLRQIVERASRYGIRIYLFCIEPRALPPDHPLLRSNPDLIGAHRSLCVSHPRVQAYLHETCASLSREVPGLAGIINIFCGERFSNCWANASYVQECPRCRERTQAEVHSTVLNHMMSGLKEGSPSADLLAWTYLMASSTESLPIEPMLKVMEKTDPRVILLGNYEHGGTKIACQREVQVHEYSLSCMGPSPHFEDLATACRQQGRPFYAKLQMGNSYELSSLPWITVPGIAAQKVHCNAKSGTSGAMLGWIVGGVPGPMLKAAGEATFAQSADEAIFRAAATEWGDDLAPTIVKAWEHFAHAWQAYPFHNAILYWGPLTRAPAYPLHLEQEPRLAKPYNWGLDRQRQRQPFENDPARWLGNYTIEEITSTFRTMAERWNEGLKLLRDALTSPRPTRGQLREWHVAEATRLQLLATANIYEFNALRIRLLEGDETVLERMHAITSNELKQTHTMMSHMREEPWIGYQSEIFGYSYTVPMLETKCRELEQTLDRLCRWQKYGVEQWVLEKRIADIEEERPDNWPDVLGD